VLLIYTGHNPSALRSRDLLVSALFQLLKTNSFAEITVRQLTQEAQLSRQTFYQIFSNKTEIVQFRLQTLFIAFQQELAQQPLTIHTLVSLFFDFYQREAPLFNTLLDNQLTGLLTTSAKACLTQLTAPAQTNRLRYTNSFIAAGLTEVLLEWHTTQVGSLQSVAAAVEQLLQPESK
jgi:AcrR family transcriptional regulator